MMRCVDTGFTQPSLKKEKNVIDRLFSQAAFQEI